MATPILETNRLQLCQLVEADTDFIIALVNEPAFIQFIGDKGGRDKHTALDYLRSGPLSSYRERGFGLWLVLDKHTGESVGMCGLLQRTYLPLPDLGFALRARYQGHGLMQEAAQGVVSWATTQLPVDQLLALVHPENQRSLGLLRRLGFYYQGVQQPSGHMPDSLCECSHLFRRPLHAK